MRAIGLGAAAALLLTLAACGGADEGDAAPPVDASASASAQPQESTESPAPEAPAGPAAVAGSEPLPTPGACYPLGADAIDEGAGLVSSDAAAVDCAEPHNGYTVAVVGLPDGAAEQLAPLVSAGNAVAADAKATWSAVAKPACTIPFDDATAADSIDVAIEGASARKATTIERQVWLPTASDWEAGARWIRCDLVNHGGTSVDLASSLGGGITEDVAACLSVDVEGSFDVACDDDIANAQVLARVELSPAKTTAVRAAYDAFADEAASMCSAAIEAGFPNVGGPAAASLPIAFAFTGTFDCYVERTPGDAIVTG